ncbi:retrovirus-related Pol polyprotein from transposon opus [Trichonephila clavipes]|nr:retrovirus-related Pol polyprotein from transposon opus [Trichonephila clavipes]
MAFGVTNEPPTMTRAIKLAYEHLAPHNVNTYIDDISTSHDDFSYHLKVLFKILEATPNVGFKLTPGKTQLSVSEIALCVLKGLERKTSNVTIILTDDQQRNYRPISTTPILAYFKQGLPTLETDASYSGLGAVLYQDENGKRRVIEYASRTLEDAETRYHSLVWPSPRSFVFIYLVINCNSSDNYTTVYVVTNVRLIADLARYLVDLAQFGFTTVHRPGKQNVIADHPSRFPTPPVCFTVTASHQSEICTKQKQDDFCQYIFRLLKEQNPNKKTMSTIPNYNIDNNTLVRVKTGDHKLSHIFKGPFVIVRLVGAVCYEIKSRTLQNKFIKVVHVQHLRPYFKRDADVMQNNASDEKTIHL